MHCCTVRGAESDQQQSELGALINAITHLIIVAAALIDTTVAVYILSTHALQIKAEAAAGEGEAVEPDSDTDTPPPLPPLAESSESATQAVADCEEEM